MIFFKKGGKFLYENKITFNFVEILSLTLFYQYEILSIWNFAST